jgi:hypothetical protein
MLLLRVHAVLFGDNASFEDGDVLCADATGVASTAAVKHRAALAIAS